MPGTKSMGVCADHKARLNTILDSMLDSMLFGEVRIIIHNGEVKNIYPTQFHKLDEAEAMYR